MFLALISHHTPDGSCWNQAPRLALIEGDLKFLMNLDLNGVVSRIELYNRTAHPFEGDNMASSVPPAMITSMRERLVSWTATNDPIRPGSVEIHQDLRLIERKKKLGGYFLVYVMCFSSRFH